MDGSQRPLTLGSEPFERHGGGHQDSDNDEGPDDEDKDAV